MLCLTEFYIFLPIIPILFSIFHHLLLLGPKPPLNLLSLIRPFFIIILVYLHPIFQQFIPTV
jgi:hypothetical protein